jgi:hypothetical protein
LQGQFKRASWIHQLITRFAASQVKLDECDLLSSHIDNATAPSPELRQRTRMRYQQLLKLLFHDAPEKIQVIALHSLTAPKWNEVLVASLLQCGYKKRYQTSLRLILDREREHVV